jgi:hypothetical protein
LTPDTTAEEFVHRFAAAIGLEPPSGDTVDRVLRLAGVAAHASERRAAPVCCYLAALAGIELDDAIAQVERLAEN